MVIFIVLKHKHFLNEKSTTRNASYVHLVKMCSATLGRLNAWFRHQPHIYIMRKKLFNSKKIVLLGLLVFSVVIIYEAIASRNAPLDRDILWKEMEKKIRDMKRMANGTRNGGRACIHPHLKVDDPFLSKFFKPHTPIECDSESDWVVMTNGSAVITKQAIKDHGGVTCSFTDILREHDDLNRNGETTKVTDQYKLKASDFVRVKCTGNDGKTWYNIMAGIRDDASAHAIAGWKSLAADGIPLNVVVWGIDSISRNTFERKLPDTYRYMKELGAITLQGYNIVGDGTPQALIPILTGKTELELPETRKRMSDSAQYCDVYPFVWKDFQRQGYVTAYVEDQPQIGTFWYRLKGFLRAPTNHYSRPFFLAAYPEYASHKKGCMRAIPRHMIPINYMKEFWSVYKKKPKFLFSFHSELSHDDYNQIGAADSDTRDLVDFMKSNGYLNDTLFIIMSDHGHRFAEIRSTQQGKQEERMPLFSFLFPPWFKELYPEAHKNFVSNAHLLTTPFDIHETLMDIVHFGGSGEGSVNDRGISLFKKIPESRTCWDAFIEPHWCACLSWDSIPLNNDMVKRAARELVDYFNTVTSPLRQLCTPLTLGSIQWAGRFLPSKDLLLFKKNADPDGFKPDMSDDTRVSNVLYQLKVSTSPGGGIFEASMVYNTASNEFTVKADAVSRINKYGNAPHCIMDTYPELRPYCYCSDLQT